MKLKLQSEKLNIYTITNRFVPVLHNDLYVPFQVGLEKDLLPSILRDNTLENISDRNQKYSELTAAYWLWKNLKDFEYIGLCHYRRYFNFYHSFFQSCNIQPVKKINIKDFINLKIKTVSIETQRSKIIHYLKKGYVIIPKPINLGITINEQYELAHNKKDWDNTKEILLTLYPEYKKNADCFFKISKTMSVSNMLISSKQFWDNYHNWLFNILFELEKITKTSSDPYQSRVFGFISERLFNLYLIQNKCKTIEYQTFFVEY